MNDVWIIILLVLLQFTRLFSGLISLKQSGCNSAVDVVFALDGSDHVLPSEFIQQKAFLTSQTVLYNISPSEIQFGVFAYGQGTSNISDLNTFRDGKDLISFVSSLTPPKGVGSMSLALNVVGEILSSGERQSARKIGFIVTSGPLINTSTDALVQSRMNSNKIVVLVGVGQEVNETDMIAITGNSSYVIKIDTFESLFSIAHSVRSLICTESPHATEETEPEKVQKRNSRLSVWSINGIPKLDPTAKKGLAHDEQRNSIVLQDRVVNASFLNNVTLGNSDDSKEEKNIFFSSVNNTHAISLEGLGNDTHDNSLMYSLFQTQNETIVGQIYAELVSNVSAGMYNLSFDIAPPESWSSNISNIQSGPFNTTDDSEEDFIQSSDISQGASAKGNSSIAPTIETGYIDRSLSKNVSNEFATLNSVITAFLFDTSSNLLNSTGKVDNRSDVPYDQSGTNMSLASLLSPVTSRKEHDSKLTRQFFDAFFDLLKTKHVHSWASEVNKTQTETLKESMLGSIVSDPDSKEVILEDNVATNKLFPRSSLAPLNILKNYANPLVSFSSLNRNMTDNQSSLVNVTSLQTEKSKLDDATKMESPLQPKMVHDVYDSLLKKKLFEAPFELLQKNVRKGNLSADIIHVSDKSASTNLIKPEVESFSFNNKSFLDFSLDPLKTEVTQSLPLSLRRNFKPPLSFESESTIEKMTHESTLKKKLFDSPFDLLKTIVSNKSDIKTPKSSKHKTLTDSTEQDQPIGQTAYTFDFSNKTPEAEPFSAHMVVPDKITNNDPTFELKPDFSLDLIKLTDVNKDKENTKTDKSPSDLDEVKAIKDTDNNIKRISLESGFKKTFFDSGFDFLKTEIDVQKDYVKPTLSNWSKETFGKITQQMKPFAHDGKTRKESFDSSLNSLATVTRKDTDGVDASIANESNSNTFKLKQSNVELSLVTHTGTKVETSPNENSDEEVTTTVNNRTAAEKLTNVTTEASEISRIHPEPISLNIFKDKTVPNPEKPLLTGDSGDSKTILYEANLEKKFFDSSFYLLSTAVKEMLPKSVLSSKSDASIAISEPIIEPPIAVGHNEQNHKLIPPETLVASQGKAEQKATETSPKERPEIESILKHTFFDTSPVSMSEGNIKKPDVSHIPSNANILNKDLTKVQRESISPANASHDDEDTDFSQSRIIADPKIDASSKVRNTPETESSLLDQFFHFSASVPKHSQSMENPTDIAPPPIFPGKAFPSLASSFPEHVTESVEMQNLKTSKAHSFKTFTFPVVGAGRRDMKPDGRISESADTDNFAGDVMNAIVRPSTISAVKDTGLIFYTQAMTTEATSFTRGPTSFKVHAQIPDLNANAEMQKINEISSQSRSSRAYPAGLEEQALKELRKLQLKRALMSRVTALTDRKLLPPQQMAQLKDKLIAVMKARVMKSRNIPDDTCQESPLETDPSFYKQRIGNETVVRPCPFGTLFNATACGCTINHVAETFAPCNAELLMEFAQDYEDHSGMASAVGARDVTIENGSAHFTGSSQLTIWRFSGTHIGSHLDIRVRVKPMPSRVKTQHLIGNCDMDLPMTYGMELDTEREVILFFIQTEIRGKAVLELKYSPITWNDVRLRYDGLEFSAIVNADRKSVPLGGNVVNRHVPLVVGTCDEKSGGFTGHIDKLSIYFCIRGEHGN